MVIELKIGKFKPVHIEQLQFYVALVDDRLRRKAHAPAVGILVRGSRNEHTVCYALPSNDELIAVLAWPLDREGATAMSRLGFLCGRHQEATSSY